MLRIDRDEWDYGRYVVVRILFIYRLVDFLLGLGIFKTFHDGFQFVCAPSILQLFLLSKNK